MSIYVERIIKAPLEKLWTLTQTPKEHQRWDVRFTSIHYLPKNNADDPQAFEYETRLGFGLRIRGTGTSAGELHAADGGSTSALVFGSDNPLSLIEKGNGYWRYEQCGENGTRFVTGYDYRVRWGLLGRTIDRFVFRPLMAWATAWSFDRLARWAERGTPPETSCKLSLAYAAARIALACVWLYEGCIPKLAGPHPQELLMTLGSGIPAAWAPAFIWTVGLAELFFGIILLCAWRWRWPVLLSALAMLPTLLAASWAAPQMLLAPFNVLVVNGMTAALSFIVLLLHSETVRASACRWGIHSKPAPMPKLSGVTT